MVAENSEIVKSTENKMENSGKLVGVSAHFSGPLPHPAILAKYEEILPGAADRIIKMAEEQSKHRQFLENKVISSGVINSKLGLIFGLIIGLAGIIASVILGIYGQPLLSGIIGIGSIGSLVGTFIYGSQQSRKEREGRKDLIKKDGE